MIVLDSNVISELMRPTPEPAVLSWIARHTIEELAIATTSVMELRHGILRLPAGRKQKRLAERFDGFCREGVSQILPFDLEAAEAAAIYLAERERNGRPLVDVRDAQIAGITLRLSQRDGTAATLATRNVDDFVDLQVANPWDA